VQDHEFSVQLDVDDINDELCLQVVKFSNISKTQIIWLGTRQQLDKVAVQALRLPNVTVLFSTVVNDLGVQLDSLLTMADHIAALSRSCFSHLRRLRSVKQSLTPDATKTLVRVR